MLLDLINGELVRIDQSTDEYGCVWSFCKC